MTQPTATPPASPPPASPPPAPPAAPPPAALTLAPPPAPVVAAPPSPGALADTSTPPAVLTRWGVPTSPTAAIGSGTYFRLGAYVAADESALILPTVTYKTSAVASAAQTADLSMTGAAEYNDPDYGLAAGAASKRGNYYTAGGTGGGNLTEDISDRDGGTVRNRVAQFEELTISTTPSVKTRKTHGVLAKTNGDMVANVDGGGIFQFGEGVVLGSLGGDIDIKAPQGTVSITSKSGVAMTAGSAGAPANIAMTAFGYVKQTAYGPMSDVRFSTSSFKTYGWSKEWFYGERFFEIHGTSTSNLYGVDQKANFGEQRFVTFAARISFSLSISLDMVVGLFTTINVSLRLEVGITGSIRFTLGFEFKFVAVFDVKVTPIDFKIVGVDAKIAKAKVEGTDVVSFHAAAMKSDNAAMKCVASNLSVGAGMMENSFQTLRSLL